jgi:co-chaperonin GroES (HSP10)
MKAVGDFIIVKFEEPSEKLDNGLYRPANSADDHKKGKVVSVGSKVEDIAVDDVVVCYNRSGVKIPVDDVEYTVVKYNEVLMVL